MYIYIANHEYIYTYINSNKKHWWGDKIKLMFDHDSHFFSPCLLYNCELWLKIKNPLFYINIG